MSEKKFYVDINLQSNEVVKLKADTLDITANLASANTKRIVYWSGQYYYSDGTNWITMSAGVGFVPYTGATTNVDLGTYNLTADHIALNVSPSGAGYVVGATEWNNNIGSSQTLLKGGSVSLKNGVDLVARVVNKVTPNTTLTKAAYQVVKVSGAQGSRLAVKLAQADSDNNSADTLGVVIETITTNQEGFIMTVGQIEDINTTGSLQGETWTDGDVLYLSPTTAGSLTNVKPNGSTGHIVIIGYVEYAHAINGKIYVKIMNGWELDELHNVYINTGTLANNDALIYESATQLWKNKTIPTALGYTPVTDTRNLTINGTTANLSADRTFTVTDANLSTSDVTTNDVSITKHGFAPKAPNDSKKYLNGTGAWSSLPIEIQLACSDETTALTAGTSKITFRTPCAITVTAVRASLTTAQTSGSIFTVDINEGGTSILSTKLTIDNTEKTSTTAATPPVISDTALADDAEITIDIDQIGDGTAKGLKVTIIGTRV